MTLNGSPYDQGHVESIPVSMPQGLPRGHWVMLLPCRTTGGSMSSQGVHMRAGVCEGAWEEGARIWDMTPQRYRNRKGSLVSGSQDKGVREVTRGAGGQGDQTAGHTRPLVRGSGEGNGWWWSKVSLFVTRVQRWCEVLTIGETKLGTRTNSTISAIFLKT